MPSPKATPAVEYVAIRPFRQSDPRTGKVTIYQGSGAETYTGPMDLSYLLDPNGPDGRGPLIAEKSNPAPAAASGDDEEK